ncbi:response regulator transcription factor [Brevibacterium sp. BRM-1]|uniref:response regulator n=1 Tax=Brevibacterium sp. BRM-1 TaxID=2999062 RepID=UPI002282CC90|nr:response regulator transcription factor [Brevibacterium sp. BRM-1]WAL41011.1 response regulator transcription factor [Brevibacterium sp. BRM-1]
MSPITVLLVDDHPVVRAGLRAVLEASDRVRVAAEASSGAQAQEALAAPAPDGAGFDLVVMDIQMPDGDGIATTAAIRTADGPPVLILTTFETDRLVIDAISAGAAGYILKDAPADELIAAVERAAAGGRAMSATVTERLARRLSNPAVALSRRELEILEAAATGESNREIAASLFISQATVKTHLVHVFDKLGAATRTEAVAKARELGLID